MFSGGMRHLFLMFLPIVFLTGCQTLHFYAQGVAGQIEILRKSRPNEKVIASPEMSETVKARLRLAERLCGFASRELALPGESAYHRYADLGRKHVVFVLHAAPEFSMEPKKWTYPVIGEMDYRGYFKEQDARAYADSLGEEGYEIYLGGTDAYSTLGMFHDPVLNTFVGYPEIDFTELIFHELTHRKIFRRGETTFNESLANVVAEEGVRRWLVAKGRSAELADYEERLVRRRDFFAQIEITGDELRELYASGLPDETMRERKREILGRLKSRARALQERWGTKQLEGWLKLDLTNAHLLALVTYNEQIPMFRKLLRESDGDFEAFFRKVENIESNGM